MNDTTKIPHCPRCGGELVHLHEIGNWYVCCSGCDFHDPDADDQPAYGDRAEAAYAARRLVRAELARQALEMRTHAHHTTPSKYSGAPISPWPSLSAVQDVIQVDYYTLGQYPIRLPGDPS